MLEFVVTSTNQKKIEATRRVLESVLEGVAKFTVKGCQAASGVSDQPLSAEETKRGAVNRIFNAKCEADFIVSIESGVEREFLQFFIGCDNQRSGVEVVSDEVLIGDCVCFRRLFEVGNFVGDTPFSARFSWNSSQHAVTERNDGGASGIARTFVDFPRLFRFQIRCVEFISQVLRKQMVPVLFGVVAYHGIIVIVHGVLQKRGNDVFLIGQTVAGTRLFSRRV